FELREEERRDVELTGVEELKQRFSDRMSGIGADVPVAREIDVLHDLIAVQTAELIAALLADGKNFHRLAGAEQLIDLLARGADDLSVEAAAQAALARHHNE